LALLDDVPASPASRRLASTPAALGTRPIVLSPRAASGRKRIVRSKIERIGRGKKGNLQSQFMISFIITLHLKNMLTMFTHVNTIMFTSVNIIGGHKMKKMPEISNAEHQVMRVVWKDNPITGTEIISRLMKITDWKSNTIKTFINRLLNKGALGYEKSGRGYSYYPLIDQTDFYKNESRLFLKRIFGGSLKPMLATMVENDDLSLEDVEELKRRITEKEKGK
jgi:BlaI family transcriptional regulator, penicillinase repressor